MTIPIWALWLLGIIGVILLIFFVMMWCALSTIGGLFGAVVGTIAEERYGISLAPPKKKKPWWKFWGKE